MVPAPVAGTSHAKASKKALDVAPNAVSSHSKAAPNAVSSHSKVSKKSQDNPKLVRSSPLLIKKPHSPDVQVLEPIREDALLVVDAPSGDVEIFRTVSQDLSVLTGRPRSTSRAALDAVANDREEAYRLLMSDLTLTVVDSLPCDIVPLESGEAAWLDSEEKVICAGMYGDCSLLRCEHGRNEDLRLFALEPVQVICLLSAHAEPLAPGWEPLELREPPQVGIFEHLHAAQACKFDPGPVVVPLGQALIALVRVVKNPGVRPPGNSIAPPSQKAARLVGVGLDSSMDREGGSVDSAPDRPLCRSGLHRYKMLSEAGSGAFGTVHLAETDDGGQVAIKVVRPDTAGREEREAQLLQTMNHPCIVKLVDSFQAPGVDGQTAVHIVMEYLPETLHARIGGKPLDRTCVAGFSWQLLRALAHLHGMNVAHRDVKPENVLVGGSALKLADFGSAKRLEGGGASSSSYICSRWWRAPELVLGNSSYSTSVDWWSCGCVLAEMMSGAPLFAGQSSWGQMYEIVRALGTPTAEELQAMGPGRGGQRLAAHLEKLAKLQRPASRWEDLLPAYANESIALELPRKLLAYDPAARLSPAEALLSPFLAQAASQWPSQATPAPRQFTEEELAQCAPEVRQRLLALAPNTPRRVLPDHAPCPAFRRRRLPRREPNPSAESKGCATAVLPPTRRRASAGAACAAEGLLEPLLKRRRLSEMIDQLLAPAQVERDVKARLFLPELPDSPSEEDGCADASPTCDDATAAGSEVDDVL